MTAKYARQVAARRRPGMCCECGYAPRLPDRARCQKCIEGKRRRQARRAKAGQCIGCAAMATPGRQRCATCAAVAAMQQATREARRKAAGVCVRCGKAAAAPERTRCGACLDRDAGRKGPVKRRGRYAVKAAVVETPPEVEVSEFHVPGLALDDEQERRDRLRYRWLRRAG